MLAREAMPAMPAHANSLALPPIRDACTEPIDASGDFVTRHTWIPKTWPKAVFHDRIAVANAADFHFHPNLRGAGFREVAFDSSAEPDSALYQAVESHEIYASGSVCGYTRASPETLR